MQTTKIAAGAPFPTLSWATIGGGRLEPAAQMGWRLLVVYRGKHCPICRMYLKTLKELAPEFGAADISVAALSADPLEKARISVADLDLTFPVGYGLTPDEMRALGLYISDPRTPEETDRQFSEPALFVINPDGLVQVVDISNAAFARPDLRMVLVGTTMVKATGFPVRGTA